MSATERIKATVQNHPEIGLADDTFVDEKIEDAKTLVVSMSPHLEEFPDGDEADADLERAAALFAVAMYAISGTEGYSSVSPGHGIAVSIAEDLSPVAVRIVKNKRGLFPPQS